MRITRFVLVIATVLALAPSVSFAQDKKFHVNFGGGPTFNAGDLGDHFGNGWGPAIGVTVDANALLGFQFEYAYRHFGIKDDAPFFGATEFDANHTTHQLDFNLVMSAAGPDSAVRPYFVAGPGAYYRSVEITKYVGTGVICDPFWYVCGTYPVDQVLGSRGGWDFGFNLGGGVGFKIADDAEFFVEMRFHHVYGPEITDQHVVNPLATSTEGSTNGTYYPLTFGFRF